MKRPVVALAISVVAILVFTGVAVAQSAPVFKLGFLALADRIPDVAGVPTENEYFNLSNGNSEQHTTKGLMVWRKADNWTAYTNGYMTWINGPNGVQSRLNTVRFGWEKDAVAPTSQPAPVSQPALTPQPTPAPQVAPQPTPATAPAAPTPQPPSMRDRAAGSLLQLSDMPAGYHVVSFGWSTANGWPSGRQAVSQYAPDVPARGPVVSQNMYLFDTDSQAQAFLERNTTSMNSVLQWVPSQVAGADTVMSYEVTSNAAKGTYWVYFRVHNVVGLVRTLVLGGVSTSLDQATGFAQTVVDRLVSSGG